MEKLILDNGREIKFPLNKGYRGWDASDEYILNQDLSEKGKTLVIGDTDGALSYGVPSETYSLVTSVIAQNSIEETLSLNKGSCHIISSLDDLPATVESIVIKLPRYVDLLEYYLQIVGNKYPGVKVICGGMVKYMPISMVRLTEEYFTDVTTSLAKKKARLMFGTSANNCKKPTRFPKTYTIGDLTVVSYPGVFSSDHLDIGTRFLIEHIPADRSGDILDLGCASGAIGLVAKEKNPNALVYLTDESYLATTSAKDSFKVNGFDGEFHTMNVLKEFPSDSMDIILCNPPFHNGNRVEVDIAIEMFKQSRKVLRRGGTLFVVANKHLGYHKKLRDIYHNLKKVGENEKFFIYSVRKV